ncbi:L-serine dehydratase, iron-sulfur-dependent subunit beta [Candidatus Epulonipiscium fishelsonii]|uniref:L-serine dehydratase, iron-sulfur-dependent subunit beta n=1 Tax=Candidatus Epulonipiscium fishelsonii TaxID=77094 RepID=A0ACC8X7U9_9FIRM|nr:L-serine dehydratase, iron-sulfur-dependent subunit beta [Epulopiscium sp. SCG-B11WGA-EpuloA1]ONI40707.1 L-serine dehydratase, iron-sulfur-dependent subunit beta [Epulopiscium sp. SCG-B05WGA-EpuloA1]
MISVFDVIGPNMIGPSSSHTAGALRIALMAKNLVSVPIEEVEFILYGSFAKTYKGHGTDKALLAGILRMNTEDEHIKDALEIAKSKGLKYKFTIDESPINSHPNTVKIIINKNVSVVGESIGGGNIKIIEINNIKVEFTGEYSTLIVKQYDKKGVLAHITHCLSEYEINIAFLKLYREEKGQKAYTVIEADQKINSDVIDEIKQNQFIIDVNLIEVK